MPIDNFFIPPMGVKSSFGPKAESLRVSDDRRYGISARLSGSAEILRIFVDLIPMHLAIFEDINLSKSNRECRCHGKLTWGSTELATETGNDSATGAEEMLTSASAEVGVSVKVRGAADSKESSEIE